MITEIDKQFLKRAMRLAMNGRGHTEPNPSVGCVLVKNGQTIGEGWTQAFGGAHAEPTALADCKAKGNDPAGATAYVTLEPCCHTNKKTPPCAPRLIEAKIARVVVGCLDPNPDVNGKGVVMLRDAGIEVDCLPGAKDSFTDPLGGPPTKGTDFLPPRTMPPIFTHLELDASHFQQLIAPFILAHQHSRSYVTLKWAQTADGKIGLPGGRRLKISNDSARRLVHQLRGRSDAIVVGLRTAIGDNPSLTVRYADAQRIPVRVVLDAELRLPLDSILVQTAGEVPVFCYCNEIAMRDKARVAALQGYGIHVVPIANSASGPHHLDLRAASRSWHERRWQSILVEPGASLAQAMIKQADRVWIIQSTTVLGDDHAPAAPRFIEDLGFIPVATLNLAGDVLTEYLNTQSPAYFAPVPSADFVLAQEQAAGA